MKFSAFTLASLLALWLSPFPEARAQERAAAFEVEAAKATLSPEVKKPRFLTKGVDPVKSRFYTKDAVIITRQSGAKEEHPYVPVPLLFRVNTDELLDSMSRENVIKLAQLLKDLGKENTAFAIEGHASAEGDAQRNRELSNLRALKIATLLRDQGVPTSMLGRTEGFGSAHARHPATDSPALLQEDRRVLVVKEK